MTTTSLATIMPTSSGSNNGGHSGGSNPRAPDPDEDGSLPHLHILSKHDYNCLWPTAPNVYEFWSTYADKDADVWVCNWKEYPFPHQGANKFIGLGPDQKISGI